jgi:hypothetical protein
MDYPDNRIIIYLSTVTFVAAISFQVFSGEQLIKAIISAGRAALSIFFAWALTKEIDPDYPHAALIAAGIGICCLLFLEIPFILPLVLLLFLFRITNRISGIIPTLFDSILILLTGTYLIYTGNWIQGLLMTITFYMDARLNEPVKRHFIFAFICLVSSLFVLYGSNIEVLFPSQYQIFILLLLIVFSIVKIVKAEVLRTVSDVKSKPLSKERIIATRMIALLAGLLTLFGGLNSFNPIFPLWAAIGGSTTYYIIQKIK